MGDSLLFEDIFTIGGLDPDGKKFDKVSRLVAHSEQFDMDLLLDVNIDVYPIKHTDKFTLALASTLSLDGTPDDGTFDQSRSKSLADKYEYVMYGKVYKYADVARGGGGGSGTAQQSEQLAARSAYLLANEKGGLGIWRQQNFGPLKLPPQTIKRANLLHVRRSN